MKWTTVTIDRKTLEKLNAISQALDLPKRNIVDLCADLIDALLRCKEFPEELGKIALEVENPKLLDFFRRIIEARA